MERKGGGGQGKLGGVGKGYVVPVCLAQTFQTPPEKESKGGRHDIAKLKHGLKILLLIVV